MLVPMNTNNYTNDWIFNDGVSKVYCTTFPFAYRLMHEAIQTGIEKKRKLNDMANQMSIISPIKTPRGDIRKYSYTEATSMANDQGLLHPGGRLDKHEFQGKYQIS